MKGKRSALVVTLALALVLLAYLVWEYAIFFEERNMEEWPTI